MKITHYYVAEPLKGLNKQYAIFARGEGSDNGYYAVMYFRRPKWIKDDAAWDKFAKSVMLKLPKGFELS